LFDVAGFQARRDPSRSLIRLSRIRRFLACDQNGTATERLFLLRTVGDCRLLSESDTRMQEDREPSRQKSSCHPTFLKFTPQGIRPSQSPNAGKRDRNDKSRNTD
jgi:hypothetical protein